MAWKVEFSATALKQLNKLDKTMSRRILKFLHERVERLDDARTIDGKLQGTLSEFWKYRVGDYRIICSLEDDRVIVLVLRIGHRSTIYKL